MNIIGICKECGSDVNLLENEIDDCIYECPVCKHPHTLFEFCSWKDDRFDVDEMELEDVMKTCRELYGDTLNEDGIRNISRLIMKMSNMQNRVYEYVSIINNMVEDPKIITKIMQRFAKVSAEK